MHSPSHTPLTPQSLNTAILQNKDDILFYFTCIRISPLFPNWFINLCAPLTSISLKVFAIGSFLGLIPASVLGACVQPLFLLSSIIEVSALFSSSLVHHTLLQLCGQGACRPGCCWRAAAHSDIQDYGGGGVVGGAAGFGQGDHNIYHNITDMFAAA